VPIDDLVRQAMARWPDVPAVRGWLRLDRRGRWLLVDRGMPGFDEALHGAGSEITSPPIVDFIGRNYGPDEHGRWHWQNGPQRVFVRLHYAPFVYRAVPSEGNPPGLETHNGLAVAQVREALVDEAGGLVLRTDAGVGVVSDRDLGLLAPLLQDAERRPLGEPDLEALLAGRAVPGAMLDWGPRRVPLQAVQSAQVSRRFAFNPDPRPAPGEPDC
jgi:hypothetical protein